MDKHNLKADEFSLLLYNILYYDGYCRMTRAAERIVLTLWNHIKGMVSLVGKGCVIVQAAVPGLLWVKETADPQPTVLAPSTL